MKVIRDGNCHLILLEYGIRTDGRRYRKGSGRPGYHCKAGEKFLLAVTETELIQEIQAERSCERMLKSLDRGLKALEILATHENVTNTELADLLGVDKSTASRIIETLKQHDMVQNVANTKKYRMGYRILHLGEQFRRRLNILDIAHPILHEVSKDLKQSIHLCAYNKGMAYVIDQVVSDVPYSMSATVGMIEPLHSSSVGKCILAYRGQENIDRLLNGYEFTTYTQYTITNREDLLVELEKIRKRGYAVDDQEMFVGVRCIALPVFNYMNSVRYSIGLSGPIEVMQEENVNFYVKKLGEAGRKISRELGYQI